MREDVSLQFFNALKAHFLAEREAALATLKLYLTDSVAVGEYPNILEEMKKLTKQLADSEEALTILQKYFTKSDEKT